MQKRGRPHAIKAPLKKDEPKTIRGFEKEGKRKSEQGLAYEIIDKNFGILQIRNTANAWWSDRGKVELLIQACKTECTVLEACFYAGISEEQYYYFCQVHSDFYQIKKILNAYPLLKARKTIVKNLEDPRYALAYLERKKKDEFSPRQEHTGAEGKPLIPERYSKMSDEELEAERQRRCKPLDRK